MKKNYEKENDCLHGHYILQSIQYVGKGIKMQTQSKSLLM